MSDSDNDLSSGSASDNEPDQGERHLGTKEKFRSPSDDEGVEHPAENINQKIDNFSDSDHDDYPARSGYDQDRSEAVDENNFVINDKEDDDETNEEYEKEEETKTTKKKRGGRRKKDKVTVGNNDDGNSDGQEPDRDTQDYVKTMMRGRSAQYVKQDDNSEALHERAKTILKEMETALASDINTFQNGKPPFARMKYIKELQKHLNNTKLAKYLLRDKLLNYLAAWISPYEQRPQDSEPVYPNIGFRIDVLKILLKLRVKPEYFEEGKTKIIAVLQSMPVTEGTELSRLISQVFEKFLRVIARADKNDDGEVRPTNVIDKEELQELRANKQFEYDGSVNASEKKLEKRAMQLRRSNAVERPRDWKPPPRIVSNNLKPSKRRGI